MSGESEWQAVGLRPSGELWVFEYGHDKNAALEPHCCLDNPLRLVPAGKFVGFLTLKGPEPAMATTRASAAKVTSGCVAICGAVYDDQILHARQRLRRVPLIVSSPTRKKVVSTAHEFAGPHACRSLCRRCVRMLARRSRFERPVYERGRLRQAVARPTRPRSAVAPSLIPANVPNVLGNSPY